MRCRKFGGLFAAAIVIAGSAISGCGGSGGNKPVHPSTALITEAVGNTWSYDISGSATPTAGGSAQPVTGTAQATVINTSFNGNLVSAFQIVTTVSINGGASTPINVTYYFQQDGNGNIIELGFSQTDSGGAASKTVTTPTLANSELFPGTFSQGTAISEILHFTDTTTQAYTLLVGAPIQVNSTAGLFNTWTTTITGQASGTQYWDPGLGFFVKGNIVNQANVGGTLYNFNLAYSLTATNVSGG